MDDMSGRLGEGATGSLYTLLCVYCAQGMTRIASVRWGFLSLSADMAAAESHASPTSILAYSPIVMPYTTGTGCIPMKEENSRSSTGPST